MYIVLFSIIVSLLSQQAAAAFHPLSDEFIDYINKQGKWRAGRNFHRDTPMSLIIGLLGTKLDAPTDHVPRVRHDPELIASLPESFDARDKWSNCPSLSEIRDQGACGSCWAFGAVEAMTDRVCVYSNGTQNFHFSAQDPLSCSGLDNGCGGSAVTQAWEFWTNNGIVSGGSYGSEEGCMPYLFSPCDHIGNGSKPRCSGDDPAPPCDPKCRSGYTVDYQKDKRRGSKYYMIQGEQDIQAELFKNGPLELAFTVYADFLHYKGGVYVHIDDGSPAVGGHAVKVMGWGTESGTPYWLIANSWNEEFGEQGYFKIKRGVNECRIEDSGVAGDPQLV